MAHISPKFTGQWTLAPLVLENTPERITEIQKALQDRNKAIAAMPASVELSYDSADSTWGDTITISMMPGLPNTPDFSTKIARKAPSLMGRKIWQRDFWKFEPESVEAFVDRVVAYTQERSKSLQAL